MLQRVLQCVLQCVADFYGMLQCATDLRRKVCVIARRKSVLKYFIPILQCVVGKNPERGRGSSHTKKGSRIPRSRVTVCCSVLLCVLQCVAVKTPERGRGSLHKEKG